MYSLFHIRNFRGFHDVTLNNLPRINLIAGPNNSGKTSLLEALFIHAGGYNPQLGLRVNSFRGMEVISIHFGGTVVTLWDSLFNRFDTSKEIELTGDYTDKTYSVKLNVIRDPQELAKIIQTFHQGRNGSDDDTFSSETAPVLGLTYQDETGKQITSHLVIDGQGVHAQSQPPAPVDAIFMAARSRIAAKEEATRYGNIVRSRQEDIVLDALKVIDNRLRRLEAIPSGETVVMYVDTPEHEQLVPLSVLGDGMSRLFSILVSMGYRKGGVVLIDEIENGLHYSVLKDVWKAIYQAALAFDTQIFATTHSFEAIQAAHDVFTKQENYDYRLHRLYQTDEGIQVSSFSEETLEAAIEMNLEVR